jgi:hypothetical protein
MQFKVPNCKVMHLGHNNPRYQFKIGSQTLSVSREEKEFGVKVIDIFKLASVPERAKDFGVTVIDILKSASVPEWPEQPSRFLARLVLPFTTGMDTPLCGYVNSTFDSLGVCSAGLVALDRGGPRMFRKIQKIAVGMVSGLQQREYVERLKELRLTLFVGREASPCIHAKGPQTSKK